MLFLSTPSARRATRRGTGERAGRNIFLSTPSARRATPPAAAPVSSMSDFYPRPPRGGRPLRPAPQPAYRSHFYPRPPRGGRLEVDVCVRPRDEFLSTPSARRATIKRWSREKKWGISIHALREEGDRSPVSLSLRWPISIHALREEGDGSAEPRAGREADFYPRPPRGGRPGALGKILLTVGISIHALREEGDTA